MLLNLSPSPVSVTTPTMMPAPAQVAATLSTPSEPFCIACEKPEPSSVRRQVPGRRNSSYGTSVVSPRRKLVANDTTVAQNTDSTGEKPQSMKTTIDTSDRKWNQEWRDRFQTVSTFGN